MNDPNRGLRRNPFGFLNRIPVRGRVVLLGGVRKPFAWFATNQLARVSSRECVISRPVTGRTAGASTGGYGLGQNDSIELPDHFELSILARIRDHEPRRSPAAIDNPNRPDGQSIQSHAFVLTPVAPDADQSQQRQ